MFVNQGCSDDLDDTREDGWTRNRTFLSAWIVIPTMTIRGVLEARMEIDWHHAVSLGKFFLLNREIREHEET